MSAARNSVAEDNGKEVSKMYSRPLGPQFHYTISAATGASALRVGKSLPQTKIRKSLGHVEYSRQLCLATQLFEPVVMTLDAVSRPQQQLAKLLLARR
jgi:hypothetical protein